ncbi:MAG: hypothetical protein ACTHQQ_21890 [Solirubrobacteraceae bacterium]
MLARARKRRRLYLVGIVLALLLFLVISAVLARVFSIDGTEQTAITLLVKDEAAGNVSAMTGGIKGCDANAACRARVATDAAKLRRSGTVSILQLQPSAGFSLTSTTGTARVAWRAGSSLPVVQCVRVRRAGDALTGFDVELLRLSRRIPSDSACPRQY